ncbi:phosphatidylserine decarboxylase proenzyme, mitochondrial-like [Mizuhopecten yessoensis]|uniref:Phosphatidylserine decarboxylase proenzyme, mitochondrial n=1 Tax=Mizuhopecten yessoensis TaxID=6573 RepID=A0A210QJ93_MIZYE|nr:phosphatidylserine decarboxylase proenzyme, mitochondrial-like [Mizuhopecten yessoensis]OWF48807.1 Phosphatidylserine decarboxylase proenzyme [Mizuhopecten yessoensis]
MIVLVWEIFLASPQFIAPSNHLNQALFYSTMAMALIIRGHHGGDTVHSLTHRVIYLSKRELWKRLMGNRNNHVTGRKPGKYGYGRKRHGSYRKKYDRRVKLYRKLPLTFMSRAWGKVSQLNLHPVLRRPLLGFYVWLWGVDLDEAADENLNNYRNLSEFFRRQLKPHVRPVDEHHSLTCPCDGRVLHFGEVENGKLEQVKGVIYSLQDFLGPLPRKEGDERVLSDEYEYVLSDEKYSKHLKIKSDNYLYHCVIYLAPGDYHRFHSAANWTVEHRRHFPGDLLSVSPHVVRRVAGLYNYNERAVYTGKWDYGFFSYTAVGATNVGSIKTYCDEELQTNIYQHKGEKYRDKNLCDQDNNGLGIKKGSMFGEFNFGSTIVLVFEAPKNFKFRLKEGQKVKFGQPIGAVSEFTKSTQNLLNEG